MDARVKVGSDIEFVRYLKQHGGETMKKCFQCATCSVACTLSPEKNSFPRKEMIAASWGLKERLLGDPDIWLCHGCMDCSQQCPRGARPADLLEAVRSYIYKFYAIPRFMGEALSSPKYIFMLLFIPIAIIFSLVLITQGGDLSKISIETGVYQYKSFIAHGPIEMLFIAGNILIFALAFLGFRRYWNDMSKWNDDIPTKQSFIKSATNVLWEFILHSKFNNCKSNTNLFYGHLLVFYGFLGAMVATAIVVVDLFGYKFGLIPRFLPENMNIPLHILGNIDWHSTDDLKELAGLITKGIGMLGGIFILIGGLMFIIKRNKSPEREAKSTYTDLLFLWVLWLVAATGILSVFFRLAEFPVLGFPVYFIHLVLVFFLLWYMPYSKFAHIIYRFLGLTFLKMHGREIKSEVFLKKVV